MYIINDTKTVQI